ncbi:hypothetical protein [Owenweeksia hongkongensis]|uniref:hypothetical protein n=1 Tax=Owenweeksia hongkongensis TaxID=253245 RepID=UPI003A8E661B
MPKIPFDMEPSEKYIDGFNSGYVIRKESPELAKKLIDTLKEQDDYIQGLKDGKLQFERELDKEIHRWAEQHKQNLEAPPALEKDKKKGKDIDYDDL